MSYPLTTTLKALRDHGFGVLEYNMLVHSLYCDRIGRTQTMIESEMIAHTQSGLTINLELINKVLFPFDRFSKEYVRFDHDAEIPLTYILESNSKTYLSSNAVWGIWHATWALRASQVSERDCRLFAVYCARLNSESLDKESLEALNVSERYAKGEATLEELSSTLKSWHTYDRPTYKPGYLAVMWACSTSSIKENVYHAIREVDPSHNWRQQKQMLLAIFNGEAPWQNGGQHERATHESPSGQRDRTHGPQHQPVAWQAISTLNAAIAAQKGCVE